MSELTDTTFQERPRPGGEIRSKRYFNAFTNDAEKIHPHQQPRGKQLKSK